MDASPRALKKGGKRMIYDVENIVGRIASSKYKAKGYGLDGGFWDAPVIVKEAIPTLRNILNEELAEICLRKAELEAKCFAYEAIISNSNFKPIIETKITNEEENA